VPLKPDAQVARECAENFRTKDLVAVRVLRSFRIWWHRERRVASGLQSWGVRGPTWQVCYHTLASL